MESIVESVKTMTQFLLSLNFAQLAYRLISPYQYNSYESIEESADIENQLEKKSLQFVVVTGNIYVNAMASLIRNMKQFILCAYKKIMEYHQQISAPLEGEGEPFVTVTKEGKED